MIMSTQPKQLNDQLVNERQSLLERRIASLEDSIKVHRAQPDVDKRAATIASEESQKKRFEAQLTALRKGPKDKE